MAASRGSGGHGLARHVREERLLWACSSEAASARKAEAVAKAVAAAEGVTVGKVLYPEEMECCDRLRLKIPHFSPQQVGVASELGPVPLSVLLKFCRTLRNELKDASQGAVCICCSSQPGRAANSLLLLGAYLLLECGWSAVEVGRRLLSAEGGQRPPQRFPRPWLASIEWTPDALTIQDCLFGLEAAVIHGWLDYETIDVEVRQQVACAFDAVPLFSVVLCSQPEDEDSKPRQFKVGFWIAADPVTTVVDPVPRPDAPIEQLLDDTTPCSNKERPATPTSPTSVGISRPISRMISTPTEKSPNLELNMVRQRSRIPSEESVTATLSHAPSKEWLKRATAMSHPRTPKDQATITKLSDNPMPSLRRPADLPAFARWLRNDLNCKLLVRTNFGNEKGLPTGASYGDFFARWGVQQLDRPFPDLSAPSFKLAKDLVAEVTQTLHELQTGSWPGRNCAMMVHCKAGMGRSMSALAVLAVALVPELSASAFFGWARLARPGSVQTTAQERFLRSLDEAGEGVACGCLGFGMGGTSRGASLRSGSRVVSQA